MSMCDECKYAEDCFGEKDYVFDENCNLKEDKDGTDLIEEALRNILEKEAWRMKNK